MYNKKLPGKIVGNVLGKRTIKRRETNIEERRIRQAYLNYLDNIIKKKGVHKSNGFETKKYIFTYLGFYVGRGEGNSTQYRVKNKDTGKIYNWTYHNYRSGSYGSLEK